MEINLEAINKAMAAAIADGFEFFGLRSMSANPKTHKYPKIWVGTSAPQSRHWVDGCATPQKVGGTCAVGLSYCTIEGAVEGLDFAVKESKSYDGQKCIVAGRAIDYGDDHGEVILSDAKIIYIF